MADDVLVIPDTNSARHSRPSVPDFGTDYVQRGLELSADFDAGLLSVSDGAALHSFDGDLYYARDIGRRTGERQLTIPGGTSALYYDFDATEFAFGDPGEPSLQIGRVDADAETTTERARLRNLGVESLNAGRIGSRLYTVGPDNGNEYQSLAAAMDDLRGAGSRDQHYTLVLTGGLTGDDKDTSKIEAANYVDVIGNGHKVQVDTNDTAASALGREDLKWTNITIEHAPSGTPTGTTAITIGKQSEPDVIFQDVVAIGQSKNDGGTAWKVYDDGRPTLNNCIGIGGAGGDNASGLNINFGSDPKINGGQFYGGVNGTNCYGIFCGGGAPAGEIVGATAIGGQAEGGSASVKVVDGAATHFNGMTGRYKKYTQFFGATGTASEVVDSGNPPIDALEFPADDSGFNSFLHSTQIRITNAVSGATIDIGTSSGGSEIASGVDASSEQRVPIDFNYVEFASGDKIYVTPSDSNVSYNFRYILGVNEFGCLGLDLDSNGGASFSNCDFKSPPKANAVKIRDSAINSKKYTMGNCNIDRVAASEVGRSDIALSGSTDDASTDPIRRCSVFGSINNLTPAN